MQGEENYKKSTRKWKKIGLTINVDKTKYIIITRSNNRVGHLDIDDYRFEVVDNLKYFGVDIKKDANSHNEINIRLAAANRCFFG